MIAHAFVLYCLFLFLQVFVYFIRFVNDPTGERKKRHGSLQ